MADLVPFLESLVAAPTVLFTGALGLALLYWCMVFLGALDLELLDIDADFELDVDGALDGAVDGALDGAVDGALDGAWTAPQTAPSTAPSTAPRWGRPQTASRPRALAAAAPSPSSWVLFGSRTSP